MTGCEYLTWYRGTDRRCNRVTATRRWLDEAGTEHVACGSHYAAILYRNPEPVPEPVWLHEDAVHQAKAADSWTDAGWSEAELRESYGG